MAIHHQTLHFNNPVGADKDDSRYKCDKVTTTTDAFRVCCCGSVVTAAPTTDDSQ